MKISPDQAPSMPSASTRRATALPAFLLALGLAGCAPEQPAAAPAPAQPASFARAYVSALERSRTDEIGVANLYLLTGATAPRPVKRTMSLLLAAQVVFALGGAIVGAVGLSGNQVNALAIHDDGTGPALYAAGMFTVASGTPASRAASARRPRRYSSSSSVWASARRCGHSPCWRCTARRIDAIT